MKNKNAPSTNRGKAAETARSHNHSASSSRGENFQSEKKYLKKQKSKSPVPSLNGSMTKLNTSLTNSNKKDKAKSGHFQNTIAAGGGFHLGSKNKSNKNTVDRLEDSFQHQIYNQIHNESESDLILKERILQRLMSTNASGKMPFIPSNPKGFSYFKNAMAN